MPLPLADAWAPILRSDPATGLRTIQQNATETLPLFNGKTLYKFADNSFVILPQDPNVSWLYR